MKREDLAGEMKLLWEGCNAVGHVRFGIAVADPDKILNSVSFTLQAFCLATFAAEGRATGLIRPQ